jgi:predicted TIM-barrel fold metal-dependent hydrolase
MRSSRRALVLISCAVIALSCVSQMLLSAPPPAEQGDDKPALKAFAALRPIDAHVHVFKNDPAFQAMLERLNVKLLNVLVMDDTLSYRKELQPQVDDALALMRSSHRHIALCTTFDPYKFDSRSFAANAMKQINQNFAEGAVAVKIWKNVGMEIKDGGKYIMADDPKFEPIYQDIARHGKTLLAHQAEPDVAWGPPDPADPSWSYYQENPQWYVGDKPGFPSKEMILAARDRVLERNPELRVVGVHLGSMERSLDDIARHLDKYPNFAIDTAARMEYLMLMPREQVRNFLVKYQDRILYGTDLDLLATANVPEALKDWQSTYARDWEFLATDEMVKVDGKQVRGLKLPQSVLRKIFHDNAKRWIPGL